MLSPEELTARGLRAYELGRLLAALRVAVVVVPLATLCLVERTGREACACVAVLLLGASVWLRWRDRRGLDAVNTGLVAGSIPLVAALLIERLDLHCGLSGADSICTTFAVLLGAGAGFVISARQPLVRARLASALTAAFIAALAAGLGCVRLGAVGVASMLLGIAVGAFAQPMFARFRNASR